MQNFLGDAMMFSKTRQFCTDESGATAIEYGLIIALLGVGIIAALTSVKQGWFTLAGNISSGLNN